MKWLPAIVWNGSVWRLPLGCAAADLLAALFLDQAADQGPLADDEWATLEMTRTLASDPALRIFAALERLRSDPSVAGGAIPLEELAQWFVGQAWRLWQSGDRALFSPTLFSPTTDDGEPAGDAEMGTYAELMRTWRSVPGGPVNWMHEAPRWLEAQGPAVPSQWIEQWPRVIEPGPPEHTDALPDREPEVVDPRYGPVQIDLHRLARAVREGRMLRERFAARLHVEKMASLRQLAYGLSHEINNPLANIRTRAEQLAAGESDPARQERLGRIVGQAMRAHEMIADLMYFARPPEPLFESLDAVALTAAVVNEFADDAASRGIRLDLEIGGRGNATARRPRLTISADPHQLADALRALLRNAIEAVGERGAIHVEVGRRGKRALWIIADSGPGLGVEARRHAFDPYYSGREAGRGLGLGLCRVYRVARAHGGGASIDAASVGCRVRMWTAAAK